jgi:hypothetical protein
MHYTLLSHRPLIHTYAVLHLTPPPPEITSYVLNLYTFYFLSVSVDIFTFSLCIPLYDNCLTVKTCSVQLKV